jgi:hypothetical protein
MEGRQVRIRSVFRIGLTVLVIVHAVDVFAADPPQVLKPVLFDQLPSLRDVTPVHLQTKGTHRVQEVGRVPILQTLGAARDPVVQSSATSKLAVRVESFEGVGRGGGYSPTVTPPDPTGAVGKSAIVEWVNLSFEVLDKASHAALYPKDGAPADGNTLWSGFGKVGVRGHECATTNDGDPIVIYDQLADRWLFSQFSFRQGHYLQCVQRLWQVRALD